MRRKASSSATSQRTCTGSGSMPPPSTGLGARRVHNTTLVGYGYPEATPSENGSAVNLGFATAVTHPASGVKAAIARKSLLLVMAVQAGRGGGVGRGKAGKEG